VRDPRIGDHATGLELQLEELVIRRERARRKGWADEVHALEVEISAIQLELADVAEQADAGHFKPIVIHGADTAEHLIRPPKSA
jgi:hypothetical protein